MIHAYIYQGEITTAISMPAGDEDNECQDKRGDRER